MATHTESTVTVNHPLDAVHAALVNESFWDFDVKNLTPEPGEVHGLTATDGGAVATLFEVLPVDLLPDAVRSMVSQALKVKRVVEVGPVGDTVDLEYTADVKGTPVSYKGEATITGEGDTTTFDYEHEISVDIPFMGPSIEPKVADALNDIFAREAQLLGTWISEHAQ